MFLIIYIYMVNWTYNDDSKLIEKHTELGDEWSLIAKYLTEKRQKISNELGELTANDAKNRMDSEIIKDLSNIDKEIKYLEKYYTEKTEAPTITSLLSFNFNFFVIMST